MTLLSTLGYSPLKLKKFVPPSKISASDISIVIPVKDNQSGIDRFLTVFFQVTPVEFFPRQIIIVDNNSNPPLFLNEKYPISVKVRRCSRPGPGAARNVGLNTARTPWILFTDSDCIPTPTTIAGYLREENKALGYAGNIEVVSNDSYSNYYRTQETLIPPHAIYLEKIRPDYLVTANCLVSRSAIKYVGGFDESFKQAGGEDIDLAFRLLQVGELEYCSESMTRHEFEDGLKGLVKRFIRYGKGNRQLAEKFELNLRPRVFCPVELSLTNILLSQVQHWSMTWGYYLSKI